MSAREFGMTTAGVVAVMAWVAASVTAWLLVTAPTKIALAVQTGDAEVVFRIAVRAAYEALMQVARYL
jgi:hypothetical protein